jgi:glycosyltransferase involved in cell wall biosynthesis
MVSRVEEEYGLADRIRVPSAWAKRSLVAAGVDAAKIVVVDLPLDLQRFHPPALRAPSEDLRLLFVGSIDARKGVLPLLRAVRAAGRTRVRVTLVGSTGSRPMRLALARESKGLDVTIAPGDPLAAYHAADVLVLPSLEDAFGFVASEAMASGLPVIVTDQCGSAEWVEQARAGWVVSAGDERAMAGAIEDAASRRGELGQMGARGRAYVEERAGERCFDAMSELVCSV